MKRATSSQSEFLPTIIGIKLTVVFVFGFLSNLQWILSLLDFQDCESFHFCKSLKNHKHQDFLKNSFLQIFSKLFIAKLIFLQKWNKSKMYCLFFCKVFFANTKIFTTLGFWRMYNVGTYWVTYLPFLFWFLEQYYKIHNVFLQKAKMRK